MYKIPIGVSNFHRLVTRSYLYCDKTDMIREFLNKDDEVTLITRPRRWGKTLNMSMLHHFFASAVNGIPTAGLFDDLAIGKLEEGKYIKMYQGKYPVIMLSFKDVKASTFEGAIDKIRELIFFLFTSFAKQLLQSDHLLAEEKENFRLILSAKSNLAKLETSLLFLSKCLYQHYNQKVYILIDEYDTPLNQAYGDKDYLASLVDFMRNFFSAALKDNDCLERGVLTGILRVSKESMLSGLNNLEAYTLLDEEYGSYFGFSESEVSYLCKEKALSISMEEVRSWYNGYRIGNLVMYNPWSILSCINKSGRFDVYWVNTGNNDLIKQSLSHSSSAIKSKFEQLMQGETISVSINKHLSFDLIDTNETAFWSLLLFAGYLKADKSRLTTDDLFYACEVTIPNNEVRRLYNSFFKELFMGSYWDESQYKSFLHHLITGNVPLFMNDLGAYLLHTVSSFDAKNSKKSEGFYHGFFLALIASISHTHYVRSNRESGYGRYDVLLIPKGAGHLVNPGWLCCIAGKNSFIPLFF